MSTFTKINEFFMSAISLIAKYVIAIIIIYIIYFIIKLFIKKSIKKLNKHSKNYYRRLTLGNLMISALRYAFGIIYVLVVLVISGVSTSAIIASAGVLSIAIGFGAQSLIEDVVAGIFILFEQQYDVGDIIKIDNYKGEVISLGFKSTMVKSWLGDIFIIGNGKINSVINYSQANSVAAVEINVELDQDVNQLEQLISSGLVNFNNKYDIFINNPVFEGVTEVNHEGMTILVTGITKPSFGIVGERHIRRELIEIFVSNQISFAIPKLAVVGEENVSVS